MPPWVGYDKRPIVAEAAEKVITIEVDNNKLSQINFKLVKHLSAKIVTDQIVKLSLNEE